jgi:Undecaprenyl-phosphate glucose phosphotransferase
LIAGSRASQAIGRSTPGMFRKQSRYLAAVQVTLDIASIVLCFLGAFYLKKHHLWADPNLVLDPYLDLLLIELPFIMVVFVAGGLYASHVMLGRLATQLQLVAKAWFLVLFVFLAVSFYAKLIPAMPSRIMMTMFFLSLVPVLFLGRGLVVRLRSWLLRSAKIGQRVLVFGDAGSDARLTEGLPIKTAGQWDVHCFPASDAEERNEALTRIQQGALDLIVIDLPLEDIRSIMRIAERAENEGISVYLTDRVIPHSRFKPSWERVGSSSFLALRPVELPLSGRVIKRTMDIVLSLIGIVVLAPMMSLLAVAIKLTSRGPIFYLQRRVGHHGKPFTIVKFRTMIEGAEDDTGPVMTAREDSRRTWLGSLLRRTNLDETPQLFNVLGGSMSLVGPRPERPEFVQRFKEQIAGYTHKHWVKPGMTGLAQVSGLRGDCSLEERIRHDIQYMETWSIWLDIKIIVQTMFRSYKNAY